MGTLITVLILAALFGPIAWNRINVLRARRYPRQQPETEKKASK